MPFKVGVCGFPVRRQELFLNVDAIEVQRTFYQPETVEKYRRLREETPPTVEYTLKVWQGVSHKTTSPTWRRFKGRLEGDPKKYGALQPTEEVYNAFRISEELGEALEAKLLLIQLPPSLAWEGYMKETLSRLREMTSRLLAIEPRHESWFQPHVVKTLSRLGYIFTTDPFKDGVVDTHPEVLYLRLHGISGLGYVYTHGDMERLLAKLAPYREKTIYIMFNNIQMYRNATELRRLIGSQ